MFNPMPLSPDEERYQQLAHATRMLGLIGALGSHSVPTKNEYNYGQTTGQLTQQINSDFINSLLNPPDSLVFTPASKPKNRRAALQRRYSQQ